MILSCIVCDSELSESFQGTEENQPHKATCFMTQGHYGSTFFDPMDGTWLEINVCDDCLKKAQEKKQILHYINYKNNRLYDE